MNQNTNIKVKDKIHEDLSPTRNLTGLHLKIVASIAIIWSLFQLWYASPFPFLVQYWNVQRFARKSNTFGFCFIISVSNFSFN